MTIDRTDDPENPLGAKALKAAFVFGTGSRTPSGPAVMSRVAKAGHMIAIDPTARLLIFPLASEGPFIMVLPPKDFAQELSDHTELSTVTPAVDCLARAPTATSAEA